MPQRPTNLNLGFDTTPFVQPPPEPKDNGLAGFELADLAQTLAMPGHLPSAPTRELLGAAFQMDNDVVNALDLMGRKSYSEDPNFDVQAKLKADGLWNDYKDNFVGVRSAGEYADTASRINQENHNRELLSSAGWAGAVASTAAGLASPTMLLPFAGEAKGFKAVLDAFLLSGTASVLHEAPLQLNQETRPLSESVTGVAMGTILGTTLGSAVSFLKRPIEEAAADIATAPRTEAIQPYRDIGTSAGAEAITRPDVELKPAKLLGTDQTKEFAGQIGPLGQIMATESPQGKWMAAQLADAGLSYETHASFDAVTPGGTAENRIRTYNGALAEALNVGDDLYAKYFYGTEGKTNWLTQQRAKLGGAMPGRAKLSKGEFGEQTALAMEQGDAHDIPEVAAYAKELRSRIYDPLYERAIKAGIYKTPAEADAEIKGALSYLNRDYNTRAIQADKPTWLKMLADHFEEKLQAAYQTKLAKILSSREKVDQRVGDFNLTPAEVTKARNEVRDELQQLNDKMTPEEKDLEDFIHEARSMSRDRTLPKSVRDDAKEQTKILEGLASTPDRAARRAQTQALQQRLRSLTRSRFALEETRLKKLIKVDRAEELSIASLNRTVRSAQKFLGQLDNLSDDALNSKLSGLRNQFEKVAQQYDRGEERIGKLRQDETDAGAGAILFGDEFKQADRATRLDEISAALEHSETLDRDAARALVQDALDETLSKVNGLNARRAIRAQRLEDAALKISPERVQAEIAGLRSAQLEKEQTFLEEQRLGGAEDPAIQAGFRPQFRRYAEEIAKATTDKVLGTNARLAGMDLLLEPRGAEMMRTLDLPTTKVWPYLNHDIEDLTQKYVRTLAPDIEITQKLGEYAPDLGRNLEFVKLGEEENARIAANQAAMEAKDATPDAIKKANLKIADEYSGIRRNLEAMIGRLRHTWVVPGDPAGLALRVGRIARNLNTLRFMNLNVVTSSYSDVAQPIMRYGMLRTFKQGWVPFLSGALKGNWTNRQLKLAGAAVDLVLHSRAHAITDINDYLVRGSKFEKSLEWLSNRAGIVGLFDYWTTAMKQVAGTAANAEIMDDIRSVMTNSAKGKDLARAYEHLADAGLGANEVEAIWKEVSKPGGSDIVDGIQWPNTEAWDNKGGAVDAYRQALVRHVESTIITPGVGERPKFSDTSLVGQLLWQFHSFAASSTSKTYLAGLQRGDVKSLYGAMISLALGTFSYYAAAKLAGGRSEQAMQAELDKGNWGHFVDEGIARSGLVGIFGNVWDALSTLPGAAQYVRLGGVQTARTGGDNLLDQLGGPTYDLLKHGTAALADASQVKVTRSTVHNFDLMLPWQNNYLMRRALNTIEGALPQ
jgi:uncharacterized protein YeeX (DUF496 family)